MSTIAKRFSAVLSSLEDFYSVTYFNERTQVHRLSTNDIYLIRALFNHKLVLKAAYDDENEVYTIVSHSDTKLYRMIHPTQPDEYYPISGEGASLSEALIDFIQQFLRPLRDGSAAKFLYFIIHNKVTNHERMFQYDPELFLAVRTDTLLIAT